MIYFSLSTQREIEEWVKTLPHVKDCQLYYSQNYNANYTILWVSTNNWLYNWVFGNVLKNYIQTTLNNSAPARMEIKVILI